MSLNLHKPKATLSLGAFGTSRRQSVPMPLIRKSDGKPMPINRAVEKPAQQPAVPSEMKLTEARFKEARIARQAEVDAKALVQMSSGDVIDTRFITLGTLVTLPLEDLARISIVANNTAEDICRLVNNFGPIEQRTNEARRARRALYCTRVLIARIDRLSAGLPIYRDDGSVISSTKYLAPIG